MIKLPSYLDITKVYTEHAYVQHPYVAIEDDGTIFKMLDMWLRKAKAPSFYHNHYVVECQIDGYKLYIGYNDNELRIGSNFTRLDDSEVIELLSIP